MPQSMLFAVLLVCAWLVAAEDPTYPDAPAVSVTATDSDYTKNFLTFSIQVTKAATGTETCGYNIELSTSTKNLGHVLEKYRPGSAVPSVYTATYTSTYGRWNANATKPTLTITDADSDGNQEVVLVDNNSWLESLVPALNTYYVQVKAVSCATNEAINSDSPGTASIVDVYYPSYAPLIATQGTFFSFDDTLNTVGAFSGSLVIFTDSEEESSQGVTGYVAHTSSVCTAFPGCDYSSPPADAVTFTQTTTGKWTATLANFAPAAPNQIYILAKNAAGISVERQIRLTDLWPAPSALTDLPTYSAPFVAALTPEKLIHSTNQLSLCFADQMKLGVSMNDSALANAEILWKVKGSGSSTFRTITGASNFTYGPLSMYPTKAGEYRVDVRYSDSTVAQPYITEWFQSSTMVVSVKSTPQWPESGIPESLSFSDTNTEGSYISGTLSFSESTVATYYHGTDDTRQFEYYLVYLSDQPACTYTATDTSVNIYEGSCAATTGRDTGSDVRLGVVPYSTGAQSFTITNVYVGDVSTTPKYIHVTAYETAGAGAESKKTTSILVEDVIRDSAQPIPLQSAGVGFYDSDGTRREIAGRIEFYLDPSSNYSQVERFEVYQYTESSFTDISELEATPNGVIASFLMPASFTGTTRFSMFLGTYNNTLGSEAADPGVSFAMDDANGNHYDYLLIVSRTAANPSNAALGYVASDSAAYVMVEDRDDEHYFIGHVATYTGSCPSSFCPNGNPSTTVRYWPYAEQTESGSGVVTIYWLTAHLDQLLYEVDEATYARLAEIMDNTALDDMSSVFKYDISLGSDSENSLCSLQQASSWPFGSPTGWLNDVDLTQHTLFYITADYEQLKACGFSDVVSKSIVLEGTVTLSVVQIADRTDSIGSTTSPTAAQLSIQAVLRVTFKDSTHASVASVNIDNVLVVDSISASVTLSSAITFYDEAFLTSLDTSSVVFTAGSDDFFVEHALESNQNEFYMQLERMWFSAGRLVTDSIEYLVPHTASAYTNSDSPATPGRYRFQLPVPYLLNCKPCYMHLVSSLSRSSSKKSAEPAQAETTKTLAPIFVELNAAMGDSDSSTCAQASLLGAVAALVASRF